MDECVDRLQYYCDKLAGELSKIPQNYKLIEQYGHLDKEVYNNGEESKLLKIKLDELGHRLNSSKFGLKMIEVEIDNIKERESSHDQREDPYLP
jgi:hypothetical protein